MLKSKWAALAFMLDRLLEGKDGDTKQAISKRSRGGTIPQPQPFWYLTPSQAQYNHLEATSFTSPGRFR